VPFWKSIDAGKLRVRKLKAASDPCITWHVAATNRQSDTFAQKKTKAQEAKADRKSIIAAKVPNALILR